MQTFNPNSKHNQVLFWRYNGVLTNKYTKGATVEFVTAEEAAKIINWPLEAIVYKQIWMLTSGFENLKNDSTADQWQLDDAKESIKFWNNWRDYLDPLEH